MNRKISDYSDIKDIESVVGTFRQLVSKLSREGHELGELYMRAERKAAHYALVSEAVIESVTSCILVVEKGWELGLVNSSAKRFLGIPDGQDLGGRRLNDLFSDARDLESLVKETFQTGQNSSRNLVTIKTLDGTTRQIGASISGLESTPSSVEAVIVVFAELGTPGSGVDTLGTDEKVDIERDGYLRGVLDSYDLLSRVLMEADRGLTGASGMELTADEIAILSRSIMRACDLMMVFALLRGASGGVPELVDVTCMVESVLARGRIAAYPNLVKNLSTGMPGIKTIRKVLDVGLEMLIEGCMEESPDGVEVTTGLSHEAGVDVVRVVVTERGATRPIVEIGDSLREFAEQRGLRREAGLLLLKSLPSENHKITVDRRDNSFSFSVTIAMPIHKKAGPSSQTGDFSEAGQDEQ